MEQNAGSQQRLGLIGKAIGYSLSPTIHSAAAEYLGLDIDYQLIDLPTKESVHDFVSEAWRVGFTGLNVTQPWKNIFGITPVNTLFRSNTDGWSMTCTDGDGLKAALGKLGITPDQIGRIIFLGNGGVVDAIAASFPQVRKIDCLTRRARVVPNQVVPNQAVPDRQNASVSTRILHPWSPAAFKKLLNEMDENEIDKEVLKDIPAPKTLIVQATPLPLQGDAMADFGDAMLEAKITSDAVTMELCYGVDSAILRAAQTKGLQFQDGLPMLIEQARLSQTIWWGKSAPYEILLEACQNKRVTN